MSYHKRNRLVQGYECRKHPLYDTWYNMKRRCSDPKLKAYKNYGGRGIGFASTWKDFENFALDMGLKPKPELTLERRNNDKGYTKDNCYWGTRTEQSRNRRLENVGKGARDVKTGRFIKRDS